MQGSQHVFSHQQFTDWSQSQGQQQQQHLGSHHNPQQQQQQQQQMNQHNYARMAANSNASAGTSVPAMSTGEGLTSLVNAQENGATEEQRRMLDWIAQLLRAESRETALLDLSKKREQVPELALILWHSFGWCKVAA